MKLDANYYNERFLKEGDVSIPNRIESLLSFNPRRATWENQLDVALNVWRNNNQRFVENPELFFEELPEAVNCKLSDIHIDQTLQRYVYWGMEINILQGYESIKVQPIRVYKDKNGKIICWDGQHTVIVLYLIITRILGLNPSEVNIPVVIAKGHQRADMRRASMGVNGDEVNIFNDFDRFEQYVYGVRKDGITIDSWLIAEQKQQYLEQNGLFLSDDRMFSNDIPGALTRTNEIMNLNFDPIITKYFAQWCYCLNGSNRRFDGIEVALMYRFFDLCERSGMSVSLQYIQSVADACRGVLGDDFNGLQFWAKAKLSLENHIRRVYKYDPWYNNQDGSINANATKRNDNREMNYLVQCLEHHGIKVPVVQREWIVKKEESF